VFTLTGGQLPLSMGVTFLAALVAIVLVFVMLCRFELHAKAMRARLRRLERATAAALDHPAPSRPARSALADDDATARPAPRSPGGRGGGRDPIPTPMRSV
jgi:cell division protein FtsN